ncbi:hypothetical protein FDH01_gp261 [Acinetobacter phage vB_AbaM_ME3]|uniref:Putative membrane protein n=1 Tax=Acinetobacter phage vB_AbaM_ME3 TaxID=1837876 RepID=A0A172Q0H4_9CAUD|nr:hypothetical protein FDH01_gp261 [Acinetobacter phage vB_AbaM_ME3]AND75361.1 putative membrane protein [Acinetobacter phage vB_AbaM_ME3]
MNDLIATVVGMTAIFLLVLSITICNFKKLLLETEERLKEELKKELDRKVNRLPDPIKTEIHYYPTMYSSPEQTRKRDREVTQYNHYFDYRGYSEWTTIEVKALRDEWVNKKLSIEEIARLHKRSSGAIISKLKSLGMISYR